MLCVVSKEQSLHIHGRQIVVNVPSPMYDATKRRFCHLVSLSARRAAVGGVLAREDMPSLISASIVLGPTYGIVISPIARRCE
jgi:hypothetical protein